MERGECTHGARGVGPGRLITVPRAGGVYAQRDRFVRPGRAVCTPWARRACAPGHHDGVAAAAVMPPRPRSGGGFRLLAVVRFCSDGLACGPIIVVLRMEVSAPDVGPGALVCASPSLMGKCLRGQELRPPIVDGAEYGDGAGTVGPARGASTPTARSEYAQGGQPVRPRRGASTPRALSWYAQGGSCVRPGRRVLPPAVNSGGAQGAAVPWAHGAVGGGFRVLPVVRLCSGGSACALNTLVLHMALGAPGVGCGALACASWSLLGQCSRGEDTRSALVERGQYAHRVRLVRPARTVTGGGRVCPGRVVTVPTA